MYARRGSTLVFVLFIMLVAMVITTTVTTVVVNNLRVARSYVQQTGAYYAMDSGLERALYYVQTARANRTLSAVQTAAVTTAFTGTLDNAASYTIATTVRSAEPLALATGEAAQWDIYEEEATSETSYQLAPLDSLSNIVITWTESANCVPTTSQIEASFSQWTATEWEDISDVDTVRTHWVDTCGTDCMHPFGVDDTHLYKVRVKALNCDITNVLVTPYNSDIPTPSVLTVANLVDVSSQGTVGEATRQGNALAPWNPALTSYYDYVLFSEETVEK